MYTSSRALSSMFTANVICENQRRTTFKRCTPRMKANMVFPACLGALTVCIGSGLLAPMHGVANSHEAIIGTLLSSSRQWRPTIYGFGMRFLAFRVQTTTSTCSTNRRFLMTFIKALHLFVCFRSTERTTNTGII